MPRTIQIEIDGNDFVVKAKEKALNELKKLDVDVLEKLSELSKSEKAINTLRNPPALLKTVLGI